MHVSVLLYTAKQTKHHHTKLNKTVYSVSKTHYFNSDLPKYSVYVTFYLDFQQNSLKINRVCFVYVPLARTRTTLRMWKQAVESRGRGNMAATYPLWNVLKFLYFERYFLVCFTIGSDRLIAWFLCVYLVRIAFNKRNMDVVSMLGYGTPSEASVSPAQMARCRVNGGH